MHDEGMWICTWQIDKRRDGEDEPYEVRTVDGNTLTYGGVSALFRLATGNTALTASPTGGGAYNATNSYLGVGNGSTAVAQTDTSLAGASSSYKLGTTTHTDATTSGGATISIATTFTTGDANFAWNEFGWFNSSTSARMMNRKVSNEGTKTTADTWTLTMTVTIT